MDIRSILLCLALAGCTAPAGPAPGPSTDTTQDPTETSEASPWTWSETAFSWAQPLDGAAVVHLVTAGPGTYACTIGLSYAPTAQEPEWDAMVAVRGQDVASWVFMGSNWHDVRAHAGPVRTDDILEPHRDLSESSIDWTLQGLQGEVEYVLAVVRPDPTNTTRMSVSCDGGNVTHVALGREALLFNAASGDDGMAVQVLAPFVIPSAGVLSGKRFQATGSSTLLVTTAMPDTVAQVDVAGPGGNHVRRFAPDASVVEAFFAEGVGIVHIDDVGGAGNYSYQLTEAALWGVDGALVAVTPL